MIDNFTDVERIVFTICVVGDTFAASVFFAFFVYYKLTCLFSRHGRWARGLLVLVAAVVTSGGSS